MPEAAYRIQAAYCFNDITSSDKFQASMMDQYCFISKFIAVLSGCTLLSQLSPHASYAPYAKFFCFSYGLYPIHSVYNGLYTFLV